MKKMILSFVAFVAITSSAFAFAPSMSFFVDREIATARVWNTSHRPIVCYGNAFGQTFSGVVLSSYINGLVIYPNRLVDIYVHSNYYDPFSTAWANIDCQFTW